MGVSQAWDLGPFAAVLQCLLKQQNTKKLYGTKNRCMPVQLGASLMAQWVPKGVGKSLKPPHWPGRTPTLIPYKDKLAPPWRESKQGKVVLFFPHFSSWSRSPRKASPEFLVWQLINL